MANHNQYDQNTLNRAQVVVVMVPFPAQGHLNQLIQLSRLVSSHNIPVHYVGTTTHNRQARLRFQGSNPNSTVATNIHFHDFQIPSFLSPLPDPSTAIKFPSHLQPAFDASLHLREPLASLLHEISSTAWRIIVIHDSMMSYVVQDVTSIPNAESYAFHSVSAFAVFLYFWEVSGKPFSIIDHILEDDIPPFEGCFTPEFAEFVNAQHEYLKFSSGHIYNACKAIEGQYIDLLARKDIIGREKQWALGPFNPVCIKNSNQSHSCLEWLEKQDQNSVIFVSFGTTVSLTDEQIKEIAIGLERSDQKFIWVLRDADKGDVFGGGDRKIELPKGFEERVMMREKGIVEREWAPQLEILGHSSTGGFLSHCGWNSCMESITMGVPIAAWPMHSDQPRNAMLVTKLLKIGVVVKDWAKRDELVRSEKIEKAIKRLMATKEGDEMRKRAAELGGAVRQSVEEGGSSCLELNSFITHITR